jgi:hypothetical protein
MRFRKNQPTIERYKIKIKLVLKKLQIPKPLSTQIKAVNTRKCGFSTMKKKIDI